MTDTIRPLIVTLAIGIVGATAAAQLGVPAAPLVGSSIAVSAAAWGGLRLWMDLRLRNLGFLVIGLSMGAGVSTETLGQLPAWGASMAILGLSVIATLLVSALALRAFLRLTWDTAYLASSPGTMAYVLALAESGDRDPTTVLTLQTLRLLALAAVLPILVSGLSAHPVTPPHPAIMPLPDLALVAAIAAVLGTLGDRIRLPAAYLLAGMAISAIAHGTGLTAGRPPALLIFLGFTITGTTLGTRFTGISRRDVVRLSTAAVLSVTLATAVSGVFAALAMELTGLPLGQIWVAYAPGGVEVMAAIGFALGYDPAFIALHHLLRIFLLMLLLPIGINPRWHR